MAKILAGAVAFGADVVESGCSDVGGESFAGLGMEFEFDHAGFGAGIILRKSGNFEVLDGDRRIWC